MKISTAATLFYILAFASFFSDLSNASQEHQGRRETKMKSSKNSKKAPKKAAWSRPSAERVITMWWVLFNKPSACTSTPDEDVKCGIMDVMKNAEAGTNDPEIVIMNASGGISDKNGFIRLAAALYKTDSCDLDLGSTTVGVDPQYTWGGPGALYTGSSKGYCPANGENTEVHIVTRDHGSMTEDKLLQLTRFTDPSCSQLGGPNLCVDNGSLGFPAMSGDGVVTRDMGYFEDIPPGCADAGECTAEEEAVQLSPGSNPVTLFVTGDSLQVVAELMVPRV